VAAVSTYVTDITVKVYGTVNRIQTTMWRSNMATVDKVRRLKLEIVKQAGYVTMLARDHEPTNRQLIENEKLVSLFKQYDTALVLQACEEYEKAMRRLEGKLWQLQSS
jgi:hypothetical protein